MKLIDKAALVAEIKGLMRANELYLSEPETDETRFHKTGAYSVCNDLLHFLDTIEVKEVDLDAEFDKYCETLYLIDLENEPYAELFECAKHFFELGLKVQKGE